MKINANLEESELNQKEIAQLAGVSVSTVSRVINDDPRISERTKQTVREILAANPYEQTTTLGISASAGQTLSVS